MPTSGSRPRAVRSIACDSMSDSPLPKRLILRCTMIVLDEALLPQPGHHLLAKHELHLRGYAGKTGERRPADLHPDAGRRADRVGKRPRPPRERRPECGFARSSPGCAGRTSPRSPRATRGARPGKHQRIRRAPHASGHPESGPGRRSRRPDRLARVAARNTATWSARTSPRVVCKRDRDTQVRKLPAEPLAVGIERLTADQLAADRDDFSPHGSFPLLSICL